MKPFRWDVARRAELGRLVEGAPAAAGLDAPDLLRRERPVALADVVATGTTFGHLVANLLSRARELAVGTSVPKRRLSFIGPTPLVLELRGFR